MFLDIFLDIFLDMFLDMIYYIIRKKTNIINIINIIIYNANTINGK